MSVHGYRHAMICTEKDVILCYAQGNELQISRSYQLSCESQQAQQQCLASLAYFIAHAMSSEPLAPIKQKTTPIPLTGLQQNDYPSHATISYPGNPNSSPALPLEPTL